LIVHMPFSIDGRLEPIKASISNGLRDIQRRNG